MKRFKRICKDKNIQIEISELQGEPWGELTTPGNSFQEFKFSLVRCTDRILNLDDDRKSTIRFWGIEAFALKFLQNNATDENLQIRNLIQKTNF